MKNTSVLNIYDAVQDYSFTSQDYFVHTLRFSLLGELIKDKYVIDLGCGKHCNLLKAACMMNHGPQFKHYVGIDYGEIKHWRETNELIKSKTSYLSYFDFCDKNKVSELISTLNEEYEGKWLANAQWVVSCFEVLEHMDFDSQCLFIENLSLLLHELDIKFCLFSTPNYNGSAAKNHISELNYKLLEEMFDAAGIVVLSKTGLSAWTKYHDVEKIEPTEWRTEEVRRALEYLDGCLPKPLRKMIWGALLPVEYSNNIMWALAKSSKPRLIDKSKLTYIKERQNAD